MLVAAAIATMVVATIAIAACYLAPRGGDGQLIYDRRPDRPRAFGYKMAWLALRTRDTNRVIAALGLGGIQQSNWNNGIGTVYSDDYGENSVFVSPPVNGWTFVVGNALPHPLGRSFSDKSTPLLLQLGGEFIEVQSYCAYPQIDYYAWARLIDGKLIRGFATNDEGVIANKGKPSKEEKTLGLKLFELRGVKGRRGDAGGELVLYPTEDHVMRLAAKWSLDPTHLDRMKCTPGLGFIGTAPQNWRVERLRKTG